MFATSGERKRWLKLLFGLQNDQDFFTASHSLFAWQFKHNRAYQKLCQARGVTPQNLRDWRQIPAAPQALFKKINLYSGAQPARYEFHTSGTTTGQPGRHFLANLDIYRAVSLRWARQTIFIHPPHRFIFLSPSPRVAPHASLSAMFGFWQKAIAPGVFCVREDKLKVPRFERQPIVLCGSAFHFVHWLDRLQGSRLPLPPGSRIMETGGFKGRSREINKSEFYKDLAQTFQLSPKDIWNEYGMTELCSQAYAQGPQGPHQVPPWARVTIINPRTETEVPIGQVGLVRWVDLANTDSVLAVQTQDLARREKSGFYLLGRAPQTEPRGCSLTADQLRP